MSYQWYVARARRRSEYSVRNGFETVGLEAFLPCVRTSHPIGSCRDEPLFPGYLFVRFDLEKQSWHQFGRTPHFLGLVAFEGVAASVPDSVVAELAQRVETINANGGLWARFRPGDLVRVALGHGESLARVIEEPRSPRARVRVLLEFMRRQVYAEVPWWRVQVVGVDELDGNGKERPPRRTRGRSRWIQGYGPRAVVA